MINTQFLTDIANYIDGRVVKVKLNETYEITDFEVKEVTNSTLALNYVVPVAELTLITKIELKDAADVVVASNDVHVPITSDTLMLQTIEVKEVS